MNEKGGQNVVREDREMCCVRYGEWRRRQGSESDINRVNQEERFFETVNRYRRR